VNTVEPALHGLLFDLRELVGAARARAAASVNSELVMLYWHIGQRIERDLLGQERAEYGQRVVLELARTLTQEFGAGFDRSNLFRMVQFAQVCPDPEIVATLWRQLSWSHIRELLPLKDPLQRDFYAQMTTVERWSVRTMRERMNTLLFERTALSKHPEVTVKAELERTRDSKQVTPDLVFRDPYMLHFLGLPDTHSERDLEDAILRDIETFLLEMGAGFTFVARQKRISVGSTDYHLDLLLFHRDLRCLVVIELKLEKFQAAHKGQMELYLNWLDKYERRESEGAPIGLILCTEMDSEHVELMNLDRDNIRVAEYLTKLPALELLQTRLHRMIELARARREERGKL
jgi:predicted nuclease of restriction endonuclease-like (RecB) superfamily